MAAMRRTLDACDRGGFVNKFLVWILIGVRPSIKTAGEHPRPAILVSHAHPVLHTSGQAKNLIGAPNGIKNLCICNVTFV
jgi:hypothetical protein